MRRLCPKHSEEFSHTGCDACTTTQRISEIESRMDRRISELEDRVQELESENQKLRAD